MRLHDRGKLGKVAGAAATTAPLLLGAGLLLQTSPVSAQTTSTPALTAATYTGRACAIQISNVQILGVRIPDQCIGDTGNLNPAGGVAKAPTGVTNVAGLLGATVVDSSAGGANGVSNASVRVAGVGILPGPAVAGLPAIAGLPPLVQSTISGSLLGVEVVAADTSVGCNGPTQGVLVGNPPGLGVPSPDNTGAATLVQGISVGGQPLTQQITGAKQAISIPAVGTITLNNRTYDAASNKATGEAITIDLNVLGVTGSGLVSGHIAIGHAESDLTGCQFGAKEAKLPPTGSLAPADQVKMAGSRFDTQRALLSGAAAALLVSGLSVAWWRRRDLLKAARHQQ